jgi:hypothetical protein
MKKLSFLFIIALLITKAYGQTNKDRVVLKNGNKVEGTIIEQRPGESIKIVSLKTTPDTLTFTMEEIDVIQKIENSQIQSNVPMNPETKSTTTSDNNNQFTGWHHQNKTGRTRFSLNARFATEGSDLFPEASYISFLIGASIHKTIGNSFEIGPRIDFGPVDEYPSFIKNLVIEPKLDMRYRLGTSSNWLEYSLVANVGTTIFKEKSGITANNQEFVLGTDLNYALGIGLKFYIIGNTGITLDIGYATTNRNFKILGNESGLKDIGGGLFIQSALFF